MYTHMKHKNTFLIHCSKYSCLNTVLWWKKNLVGKREIKRKKYIKHICYCRHMVTGDTVAWL